MASKPLVSAPRYPASGPGDVDGVGFSESDVQAPRPTVWIQAGSAGFRWPLDAQLELKLAEWERRWGHPGQQYAIHDGGCHLGKVDAYGCTCTPELRTIGGSV